MSKRPYALTNPRVPEDKLHRQIADALTLELAPPGRLSPECVCWYAIDIASYQGSAPGIRTSHGVIAGIWDVFVLYRGRSHHIEVKAPDGRLSEAQQTVGAAILGSGGRVGIARDAIDALRCLDTWGIPRKRVIREAA